MSMPRSTFPFRTLLIALSVYAAIQIAFIGQAPIASSTEAREAQVIDTIVRSGDWVLPLRNGLIPSKPPLFHWIGASFSHLLGEVSEFTTRLPSLFAAIGILAFTSIIGFRVARFSQTVEGELHQERVALISAAILSLTYGFHQLSTQAMVDMTFSLFMWGALASLLLSDPDEWEQDGRLSWYSRALFWSFLASAVLARGPIGAVLPIALAGIVGWFLAGFTATVREMLRPSIGWLAFAIPLAWYFAAYQQGGDAFLARQLLFENVQRFVGGEKINTEAWWFYGPSLLRTTAPWGLLLLWGAISYVRKSRGLEYLGGFQRWAIVPTVALVAGVTLFSLSSGKRHSYTLPLQPLVAIQCALLFSMFLERRGLAMRERFWRLAGRLESQLSTIIVVILIGFGVAHMIDWDRHPLEDIIKFACAPLTLRVGLIAFITLLAMSTLRSLGPRLPYARVWGLLVLLITVIVATGNVLKGTLKGWPLLTEQLLLTVNAGEKIVVIKDHYDEYFDPILYYAHRPIWIASASDGIERCESNVVYLAKRSWLTSNPHLIPGHIQGVTTLRELKRAFGGSKRGEDIEVFRCTPKQYQAPQAKGDLRDARYSSPKTDLGESILVALVSSSSPSRQQ